MTPAPVGLAGVSPSRCRVRRPDPRQPAARRARQPPAAPTPAVRPRRSPAASSCPRDDAPHDRLTEWWYYTGHLARRRRRALRLRVRDLPGRARRLPGVLGVAPRADRRDAAAPSTTRSAARSGRRSTSPRRTGASAAAHRLSIRSTRDGAAGRRGRWPATAATTDLARDVAGRGARAASRSPAASASSLDLDATEAAGAPRPGRLGRLRAGRRLVLLLADAHGGDGRSVARRRPAVRSTAPPGSITSGATSSRSAAAAGTGSRSTSTTATDLTLSLVRDRGRHYPLVYGTLVDADGATATWPATTFTVEVTDAGRARRPAADYPAGWRDRRSRPRASTIELRPRSPQQELDTRATTGVIYWEGSQVVTRTTRRPSAFGGQAYVELTGYGAG